MIEARQVWMMCPGTPARGTRRSAEPVAEEPDASRRGTRADGRVRAALLPLTPGVVGTGVVLTRATGAARIPIASGAACEFTVLDVPVLPDPGAGADAPLAVPLLLLLFWLLLL
jgi:hypothetical protein